MQCTECQKETLKISYNRGKEIYCITCYKKKVWKAKPITCPECKRETTYHAKGYCKSCYGRLFQYDTIRASNIKRYHNISLSEYDRITEKCWSCEHDRMVQLHHLNSKREDNRIENMVGLCPNCHRELHTHLYSEKIKENLKKKGVVIPSDFKIKNWGR